MWYKCINYTAVCDVPCEVVMAKDAELDRLKSIQEDKFSAKQRAYEVQQRAWDARSAARDEMNRAYDAKQRAYEAQQSAWNSYQSVRSSLSSRIDSLKAQQESAYQNMKRSFDNASSAHSSRDGAAARRYADEGHNYKAEAQRCTNERRALVDQIRSAKAEFERYKAPFQSAKEAFRDAKSRFEAAKSKHEQAQAEFKRAKADFDSAKKAFHDRLEKVRAQKEERRANNREIAKKAGVPSQYIDDVWVKQDSDGNYNIYFGGIGQPDGEGHGHYVLSPSGKVTYARDPHEAHGSHNFKRDAALESRLTSAAVDAARKVQDLSGPRTDQYSDGHISVKVKSGFDRSSNRPVTDVIVVDRDYPQEHLHLILSASDGEVLFSEWRKNH